MKHGGSGGKSGKILPLINADDTDWETGDSSLRLNRPFSSVQVLFVWRLWAGSFVSGEHGKQFAVGPGAELFRPVAEIAQAFSGKDLRPGGGVQQFQIVQADQGCAVSSVEVIQNVI